MKGGRASEGRKTEGRGLKCGKLKGGNRKNVGRVSEAVKGKLIKAVFIVCPQSAWVLLRM